MKTWKIIGWTLLGLLVVAQFALPKPPANQTDNPGDLIRNGLASSEVAQLLKNSCYDCHSNEVNYPWYSYVAPASLLVRHDVLEGTNELNFSTWEEYDKRRKLKKLKELKEVLEEDEMPMGIYTFIHRGAKLSEADKTLLMDWADGLTMQMMQ